MDVKGGRTTGPAFVGPIGRGHDYTPMSRTPLSRFQALRQAFWAVPSLNPFVVLDQPLPAQQHAQAGQAKPWPFLCQLALLQRIARVVGERQERAAERDVAAMQC